MPKRLPPPRPTRGRVGAHRPQAQVTPPASRPRRSRTCSASPARSSGSSQGSTSLYPLLALMPSHETLAAARRSSISPKASGPAEPRGRLPLDDQRRQPRERERVRDRRPRAQRRARDGRVAGRRSPGPAREPARDGEPRRRPRSAKDEIYSAETRSRPCASTSRGRWPTCPRARAASWSPARTTSSRARATGRRPVGHSRAHLPASVGHVRWTLPADRGEDRAERRRGPDPQRVLRAALRPVHALLAYEVPLLAAWAGPTRPHDFEIRAGALHFEDSPPAASTAHRRDEGSAASR